MVETPRRQLPNVVDTLTENVRDMRLSSPEVTSDEDEGQEEMVSAS